MLGILHYDVVRFLGLEVMAFYKNGVIYLTRSTIANWYGLERAQVLPMFKNALGETETIANFERFQDVNDKLGRNYFCVQLETFLKVNKLLTQNFANANLIADSENNLRTYLEKQFKQYTQQTTHELDVIPDNFKAIKTGIKTFELRLNTYNFKVGDYLLFKEYQPTNASYTEQQVEGYITYISNTKNTKYGLEAEYVILGFKVK